VVPYVEDHRNVLTLQFDEQLDAGTMASVQAALKNAIQQEFQLEPGELAAQPLPDPDDRQIILFYESSEGGSGVLRQLVEDPGALARVARSALTICHLDPATGADRAADDGVECEAACYDCLLDYGNQPDHNSLDRRLVPTVLLTLARSQTEASSANVSRADKLDEMLRLCDSELERKWLRLVHEKNFAIPTHAQRRIASCGTKPDFFYEDKRVAIYIDGPVHDQDDTIEIDDQVEARLRARGVKWLRFHHAEDWEAKLAEYPDIFGPGGRHA
jgi:very-short-patch-repair endonuclease